MSFADVSLDRVRLNGKSLDVNARKAVLAADLERGIAGPSLLTFTFDDTQRELIRSRLFNQRTSVALDKMRFLFDGYQKQGDLLDVMFISGGWADLRRKKGPMLAKAGTTTRTQFARRMVSEVKHLRFRGEETVKNLEVLRRGKKERTTKALERLASERQWRVFEDEDVVYFGSDAWLMSLSRPFVISESDDGINFIDPSYEGGKRATSATIDCNFRRWAARPGAPVNINGLGDLASKGRWMIERLNRSLLSDRGTVSALRKTPDLPEPKPEERRHDDSDSGSGSGSSRGPGRRSSSGWQWPIAGPITSGYRTSSRPDHEGLDIDGETGNVIQAAKPGVVTSSYTSSSYGETVVIDHGGGWSSLYAHLSRRSVGAGQKVDYSSVIGLMGSTGNSTGSHLHFEIRRSGTPVNPASYLP